MATPHSTTPNDEPLLFSVEEGIATLTMNRPDRGNSLNPAMLVALEKAWARVNTEPEIRVAIITGAGERHFCTGADVSALKVGVGGLQQQPYALANRFSPRMVHVAKPVICAVNGLCNGGGLHFIADSDIVIASDSSEFMDSHVRVGQVSALETQGIARRAGIGAALLMGLAGRDFRLSAQRAWTLGMVDLLEMDPSATMTRAKELETMICANSPRAMALTKRAIWATTEMSEPASCEYGWELLKSHWSHPDFEEGPNAFAEKREPVWNPDANARR